MKFKGWEKTVIATDNGRTEDAIAPIIISASRSTDIPAFHHEWFYNRLSKGYVVWKNPFNQKPSFVSFEKTRIFIFWTKNPTKFIERLNELEKWNYNYYFQYTLNDYEREDLEPKLPQLTDRIKIFQKLSENIGKERVIWRFDPLILSDVLSKEKLSERIFNLARQLYPYTEKLVVSFVDIECYKKVQRNLKKSKNQYYELNENDIFFIAENLRKIGDEFNLTVATCAETIDLAGYGIIHNKCIDDELMIRLFSNDKELMNFLGVEQNKQNLFPDFEASKIYLKDKGQRKVCGCIVSKDIGAYNTCRHLCKYCYANYSEETVKKNFYGQISKEYESILK